MRCVVWPVVEKNWSFAGFDRGADRAAIMLTLITRPASTMSIRRPGLPTRLPASPICPSPACVSCCPGNVRRSRWRQYRLSRKQLPKKCLRPPQTFVRQHQRLRLVHRVADQAFAMQAICAPSQNPSTRNALCEEPAIAAPKPHHRFCLRQSPFRNVTARDRKIPVVHPRMDTLELHAEKRAGMKQGDDFVRCAACLPRRSSSWRHKRSALQIGSSLRKV